MEQVKKLFFGQTYTNKTNKPIKYKLFYMNCWGYMQDESGTLEQGQSLTITQINNKANIYE